MTANRGIRVVIGVTAIGVVLLFVLAFWGQYRATQSAVPGPGARPKPQSAAPETPSTGGTSTGGGSAPAQSTSKPAPRKVVVLIPGLTFRASASPDGKRIRVLDMGDELVYVGKDGDWYRVRDAEGVMGYVSANERYTKLEAPQ